MTVRQSVRALAVFFLGLLTATGASADEIAAADLQIQGVGLKVVTVSATTGVNIPAAIQTEFGGRQNDAAPVVEGLLAVGELTGPGIEMPIRLETAPGHKFQIPGLASEGVYFLQNIRLMKGTEFLQPATPSIATVTVSNLLQTSVRVRQLSPEELRARGINIDARNYDVYEYTFSFLVNGQLVEIPFPVIVDPRTHEVRQLPDADPYNLPPVDQITPPRWQPPEMLAFDMVPEIDLPNTNDNDPQRRSGGGRISIPAALVIPNSLAVLHQFFAVTLMVTNGAPDGSEVILDEISAQIKPPATLRTVKSIPSVVFNQAVPIVDATNGVTFLVAQARGEAEWTMEGLQPGTHTIEVDVRATYKSPGQSDFPLKGTARASVVVHDPRFNVTFSHPDTVREDIDYSTFSFITNMSPVTQNIRVTNGLPGCAESPGANVCRVEGTPSFHELTIPAGEMRSIEYKLRPGITGHVFATAGSVSDDAISAAVQLHMGVSESGVPLSPATLLMPYYARFLPEPVVSANLQLLGLGYSLATAPLTPALAKHPRVIKTDVFTRAVDIARAGQRAFLGEPMRDSLAHMTLDLLGNSKELSEWDELRRRELSGRTGAASVARQIEASLGEATLDDFVSRFAAVTAWREPYLLAVTHGASLAVRDVTSNARMSVPSEAASGWVRQVPFGELNTFRSGQLAVVGRWAGDTSIEVTPAADGPFTLDVILPATAGGSVLRGHFEVTGTAGQPLTLFVTRGATALELRNGLGGIAAVGTITPVSPQPVAILGARQDLNLDPGGHKVSVLWNRPVMLPTGGDLLQKVSAEVVLQKDGVDYRGPRPISSAALQDPPRLANLTFDHALSTNADYTLTVGSLVDPLGGAPVSFPAVDPVIDNNRPGGILFGHVLKGDNTAIAGAEVRLFLEGDAGPPQYDLSRATDGAFLFEFVPRDIDNGLPGLYTLEAVTTDLKSTAVQGAVRLPGRVHFVNLVFLGRGSAEGIVRYDNGEIVKNARVVVGSTMFDQFRTTTSDQDGRYSVEDLPVGPLTFSATDADGNVTYAASEIKTPGQVLVRDLSIFRQPFPGTGTIRGIVRRGDTNAPVAGALVGVYSQGYGLIDGFTDGAGRFEFTKVPAGFVTVLAAEWNVSRESAAIDFDLAPNEVRDVALTLIVNSDALVVIEGDVIREDPLFPGDANKYQRVAGALVKIENSQAVTADGNGHFVFAAVPRSFAGRKIQAYDPITTRTATTTLPPLDPNATNNVPIFIATANGYGEGTVRVRVLNAAGSPVTGFRVIEPGFAPFGPTVLEGKAGGIYELPEVPVGKITTIWAIGSGAPPYGDQTATGTVKVEFNGHVAALTLRLPGQGTVRTKLTSDIDVIGDVKIVYPAWEEADQALMPKELVASTSENGVAGFATFTGVPALQNFTVSSQHPVFGYAAQGGKLGFDGDVRSIILQLNKLSTVRGVVYAIDGRTPIPGAAVRIEDGRQNPGIQTTLPDGSYAFQNVAAGVGFRVIAEITQDGTYRTGVASGTTPPLGGPVEGVSVVLRTQGAVDGRIVYAGYKTFDPENPANDVIDPTPGDLSDNAPVPLASFVLRELDFPLRSFGTTSDPLTADAAGRFTINNVFTGPLRISASDPGNQEIRGVATASLSQEGERITVLVGIGAEGFGPVVARVLDPNAQNAPVLNAEVTLIKGFAPFDLSSTDGTGTVRFEQVPVGTYKVTAYSKALGKSGASASFTVAAVTGAQLDVVLEFSGKVDGRLSDPEAGGSGVPGVPVTLTAQSFQTRASTDLDGDFVFDGVREGVFRLEAKDTLSNRRATAQRELTQADPNPFVSLELEPTETLHLSVYLPDDGGGNSNILAPLVNLDVNQRNNDFTRTLQGNSFQMPGLFRNERYSIVVREIGGAARTINTSNTFPKGSVADPLKLVLPAYGTVDVRVTQGGAAAANAKVTVSGGGKTLTVYTDGNGVAIASGVPLGSVSVQAVTVDGAFSGSAAVTLASQSTPSVVPIALGAFAGVTGLVEAESGGPSVSTRVVASFGTRVQEVLTDSSGRYTFQGIPTSTVVSLTYIGPDDVTVGARQTVTIGAGDASKVIAAATVRLDATPPLVATIFPADGTNNVSPDSTARITFTERIGASFINTTYFQLLPADSSTPVATSFGSTVNADGTFTVTMTPPAPPAGQQFPLQSNTLYRIVVSGEIRDLTGNKMPATRGASFITSDYTEPRVLKVVPSPAAALQPATTFEFRFNEPIDPGPWQSGGSGQIHLYKLSAAGPAGAIVAEKAGLAFVDPATSTSLFFAPNDPIEQESFYRIVFSGVRDLQGNVVGTQTFHFFSYDLIKPFVTLISPVPSDFPLISGVEYTLGVDLRNGDANGTVATDVAKVDYFRVDAAAQTYLFTATAAPWTYRFVAPDAPPGGSLLALRALATDLSTNESDGATLTWQVRPNQAPQNVTVALTPTASVYPGNPVVASVTFEDEGTVATVQAEATASQTGGAAYTASQVKNLTRVKVNDPWPPAAFTFDLPGTLQQGTQATFKATVTDVRGLKGIASSPIDLSLDTIAPEILSLSPAAQTRFNIGQKYQVNAVVKDLETGVGQVTFSVDNQTITVTRPSALVTSTGDHVWTFRSGDITVPAKNVDTTIPITVTARDYNNNVISRSTEVVYVGVNDPTVPKGAWLCPVASAVYPAGQTIPVKLQARATDDISVTGVKFTVPGIADPIVAMRVGTSDVYEATTTIAFPAVGETLTLTATVSDADPTHDLAVTISVQTVAIDITLDNFTQAVTVTDAPNYANKSILLRGSLGRLVPHVPLTIKNLIVLDGARVETLSTTTTTERKLDLTITDRLFIDCTSSVDVTSRGYLGGLGPNDDGSGTRNDDTRGRTAGNTSTGGATTLSSASHGGLGGQDTAGGVTNAVYGSISNPLDLGAGGGASNGVFGAAGGGAIRLQGGTFAIAGAVRADGGTRLGSGHAGAGGSVNLRTGQLVIGPSARITANGGDDDGGANESRGGGGGRIALTASERMEIESLGLQVQARGGRNSTTAETPTFLDGGGGTIFVARPGQTLGELFASSSDERAPASTHLTRPTPISGDLRFDRLTLGTRALVRADSPLDIAGVVDDKSAATIDATAVLILAGEVPAVQTSTTPAAGGSLIQASTLSVTYTATSNAGVGAVKLAFSPVTPDRTDRYFAYPASAIPSPAAALAVPFDAVAGPATLTVTATDRAERSTTLAPLSFSIVANTPPVIDQFDNVPTSLYPGKSVVTTVAAHDDLKVTRITLTRTIGTGAPSPAAVTPNVATVTNQTFTTTVPIDTPGGQDLTLELAVEDGFPNRLATKETKAVSILRDTVAPTVAVIVPADNALFNEGTGNTIQVRATITDAEVGVKEASVQIEGALPVAMTKSGNEYVATIPVPPVDGTTIVTRTLTVTGKDYEANTGTANITLRIQPINDPNAPVVTWACSTTGAMYPAGYAAKLRVLALGNNNGNTANGVQKVEFFVGESTTPLTGTRITGTDLWETSYTIPTDSPADSTTSVRAVVTNVSGVSESAGTAFTVIVAGRTITTNTTIAATDTSYDNQIVVVQAGIATIAGSHTFDKLIVLDGARVNHLAADATTIHRLSFTATSGVFVSCTGSIDVTGRGLTGTVNGTAHTYDRATDKPTLTGGATNLAGGSHGGLGGFQGGSNIPAAFGSLFDPNEPGGAGGGGNCMPCRAGGGVARIRSSTLVVDGSILANGDQAESAGAGGSIRIDATTISGGGEIRAEGGRSISNMSGGGGRVAIYYETLLIPAAKISASSQQGGSGGDRNGSSGTIYLRRVDATGAKISDELIVDNANRLSTVVTPITTAGTGTVIAVSGNVVTLSAAVPFDIEGTRVAFLDTAGALLSTYEVSARTPTSVTVRLDASETTANAPAGSNYRGVIAADRLTSRSQSVMAASAATAPELWGGGTIRVDAVYATDLFLRNASFLDVNGTLKARNLALEDGSRISHSPVSGATIHRLTVDVEQTFLINTGSSIDVTGRGFNGSASNKIAQTWPGVGASFDGGGGSHGGRGGAKTSIAPNGDSGAMYGSVFDPDTPGGAGASRSGACAGCAAGGGVVRIRAANLVINGQILSNGVATAFTGSGAGGSIRIDAGTVSGAGLIRAEGRGRSDFEGAGGGGRIAIYSQSLTMPLSAISAAGGTHNEGLGIGSAGTLLLKSPSDQYGELVVDNLDRIATRNTTLPTVGTGTVTAVSGAEVTLSSPVPDWIGGATIDFLDATGALVSTYVIESRTPTSVNVRLASGETTPNVSIGNGYRGVWRFDRVTVQGRATFDAPGALQAPLMTTTSTALLRFGELRGENLTLRGRFEASTVAARTLSLENAAVLTHPTTTNTTINRLTVNVGETLTVDATSSIDVSGKGFNGSTAGRGRTWPNTTTGGSFNGAGGSHGGRGGAHDALGDSAPTYGSLFDPDTPGGAGGFFSNGNCSACNAGGGVARITAPNFMLDGKVLSNGTNSNTGSGAGGSVRIDVESLTGGGEIHADGAAPNWGAGGGGRVAVYYQTLGLAPSKITAAGGLFTNNTTRTGAAGTVYLKQTSQSSGDLIVDNLGRNTIKPTTLMTVGYATATAVGADSVTATLPAGAQFPGPNHLPGVRMVVNHDKTKSWPIVGNDDTVLRLDVSGQPLLAQTGDSIRGLYRLDNLKLRNARLDTIDLLDVTNAIDKDSASVILGNNQLPPVVDPARVTLQSTPTGSAVVGSAMAVTDFDTPITGIATNTITGTIFQTTINPDGSFVIPVDGLAGQTVTFKARDGNAYPLESSTIPAGTIVNSTPVPSQIQKTTWTADPNFFARTLSREGDFMVVASYPTTNGASPTLVTMTIADPSRPGVIRAFDAGLGTIRDVVLSNGYAYIAGTRFGTVNVADPSAPVNMTSFDPAGEESAVTVVGGYAFTADATAGSDARIHIYDVSVASAPRYIRSQGLVGFNGLRFTDLIALGTDFLIGVSPDRPFNVGRDAVLIDRRDIFNLKYVTQADVASLEPLRGTLVGTTFYLGGTSQAPVGILNVANPAAPAVLASIALPPANGGIAVAGREAYTANGTGGLRIVNVANPAAPVAVGQTAVGGNAFDVAVAPGYVYVANEIGLALVPALTAPQIDLSKISMALSGTMVTVTGGPRAITGSTPITFGVDNAATGASISGLSVQSDGSFSAMITGAANQIITLTATDTFSRANGPLQIGRVPFGAVSAQVIPPALTDGTFLSRNVASHGNHLAVAGYPPGSSDKVVLYDVTERGNPVYLRTVSTGAGNIRDIEIRNGWLYFTGTRFGTLNLDAPASTATFAPVDPSGEENGILLVDDYAFTIDATSGSDARIHIFDITTPGAPRYLRSQGLVGFNGLTFHDIAALGTDFLALTSPDRPFNVGRDVVIVDRRDIHNLKYVSQADVPNLGGLRMKAVGNTVYVTGVTPEVGVVEVSSSGVPTYRTTVVMPGNSRAIDAVGATLAVADGSAGVTFLDISAALSPVVLGGQPTGGTAWDCAFNGATLYVANETGLVVIDGLGTPPLIDRNLITTSSDGANSADVTGQAQAILGLGPLTVELRNAATGASFPNITVAADGSFTGTVTGASGDPLTIKATDAAGRVSGPVTLGTIPFGSGNRHVTITTAMTDANFLSRNVAADGNDVVVAAFGAPDSGKLVVFDATDPANPVYKRTVDTGAGPIFDVEVQKGWAYFTGTKFGVLNLTDPAAVPVFAQADPAGAELALEIAGGYAFTVDATSGSDARIHIYDVSTPGSPRYLRSQGLVGFNGLTFRDILAFGTNYLVGISPDRPFNVGRDVVIIDRTDIHNLRYVTQGDVPNLGGFHGKVLGNHVFITGVEAGVGIMDLTNPAAPQFLSTITSAGAARSLEIAGSTLAIANGTNGILFVDVGNIASPRIIGSHVVPGSAFDVALSGGSMFVASELGLMSVANVATPPMLDESLLMVTTSGATMTVTGAPRALTGVGPLSTHVVNITTGNTSPSVTVNADGSFQTAVAALGGHSLRLVSTDVAGRVSTRNLGVTFGTVTTRLASQITANDVNYRSRRVGSDGTTTVAATGSNWLTGLGLTNKLLAFRQQDPPQPPQILTGPSGTIREVEVRGGFAYVTGGGFGAVNLSDLTTKAANTDPGGDESSITFSGQYAFTSDATSGSDARIHIYDLSSPGSPQYVRSQGLVGFNGLTFIGLAAYGSDYLMGFSTDRPFNVGRDVVVINRTNINALSYVTQLDIVSFDAVDGLIDGTTLYLVGAGGSMAIVDLTVPTAPVLRSVLETPGVVRAIAISGVNEIAVADGTAGITFIDVTNKANPIILGSQKLSGNATDVEVVGNNIFVGAEMYFHMISRP